MFGLGHEAGPEHFDCAADLGDLQRRQRFHDAELREANQGIAACLERLKRTCAEDNAAELKNLLRMQGDRSSVSVPELGGASLVSGSEYFGFGA